MAEHDEIRRELVQLVEYALEEADEPDQLLDCAVAASSLRDRELMAKVAARIGEQVTAVLRTSGSWDFQATYSKIDVWRHTGQTARILAEAYGYVDPDLPPG